MRDLFFIIIFILIVYATFKRPFVGASMWLWVSLFYPQGWVYGFAGSFRYNLIIALCAFVSYIAWKEKSKYAPDKLIFLVILFLFWTLLSSLFSISSPEIVWGEWIEFLKISLLFLFAILVMKRQLHLNVFIWAVALSVGFYGCLEGLKYIASGGGHNIKGLGSHALADRNELALALNMTLPLLAYLMHISKRRWIKLGFSIAIVLNVVAVLGTSSRGGLIALAVVGGYFILQSKHKVFYSIILLVGISTASQYLSSDWKDRMSSIETAQQDNSFLGRVMAWKEAVLIANDNPLTGGGFKAGQNPYVWALYEPSSHFNSLIDTSELGYMKNKAAHSIFFQVLGDHGYIGLLIFLSLLTTAFVKAGKIVKRARELNASENIIKLCSYLRLSLVAYCAGGAGVSLAYFDLLYAIIAMIYVIEHRVFPQYSKKKSYPLRGLHD